MKPTHTARKAKGPKLALPKASMMFQDLDESLHDDSIPSKIWPSTPVAVLPFPTAKQAKQFVRWMPKEMIYHEKRTK